MYLVGNTHTKGAKVKTVDLREKQSPEIEQLLKEHRKAIETYVQKQESLDMAKATVQEIEQIIESLGGQVDKFWGNN